MTTELEASRSFSTTVRLWPEVAAMGQERQLRSLRIIVQLLYLLPFAVIGLFWLLVRTDFQFLAERINAVLVLFVVMTLLLAQPFTIRLRLGREGDELHIVSSLAPLVMWSTLFISGAAGLWALVLAAVVVALWRGRQLASYGQNPIWEPLSFFVEQTGIYLFSTIVAASIYLSVGGDFPVVGTTFQDWIPAFVAVIIGALLAGILVMPPAIQMNSLSSAPNSFGTILRIYLSAIALPLLMSPFAIIIALLNAEGRTLSLVFVVIGIYLVNRLAHHMSLAEARSRQQARELEHLEVLAKRIIESPADASTLEDLIAQTVPDLFPADRVAVQLFESSSSNPWPSWEISVPDTTARVPDEIWESLCREEGLRLQMPNVTLPGEKRTFGDALLTKIIVEEADSEEEAIECVGGVYLLRHKSEGHSRDSLGAVESLASQIGTALNRSRAHAEALAFQKTQKELEFAGRIQTSFLPKEIPMAENWQISAKLDSARQTSGDFYDFIPLGDSLVGIIVADVSDKGTGAALYMALSRTLLRTFAMEEGLRPEVAFARANDRIRADAESDQFVTLIYGVLNTETGWLTYANAGHNPGYLLRAGGDDTFDTLSKTGIPLGMFEEMEWQKAKIQINPGDVLLLYTDGVTEAQNVADEEYGDDRLLEVGRTTMDQPAEEINDAIMNSIYDFVGEAPQFDDITLLVVVRDPAS
jgi:serine phosphatase RsbU (regulator of sigma subunit)